MNGRNLIYYTYDRGGGDRWFRGDRHLRKPIRRLIRGPDPIGGIDLVFLNLVAGLERLGIEFFTDVPFDEIRPDDKVGVIGRGPESLAGYIKDNPILAGVAVVGHPCEWPTLFEDYPVSRYVVHSPWIGDMFRKTYGDRVVEWAVGIDTTRWAPSASDQKATDFLIYDKVRWDHGRVHAAMVEPIRDVLGKRALTTETIRYGTYNADEYAAALSRCRAMLFLCEHETQGLAYQQAMAAGLPVLAWDPGQWLDPWRFRYDMSSVPSTSVPFFDARCGSTFSCLEDFEVALDGFLSSMAVRAYDPRCFVEERLSLEVCAQKYLELMDRYL
jgi:glycosyltransferase involved in cell wall biosynthesis